MPDSKQKLPDEICEYCQKAIISRAKAFILRERVACRVCYNRGGLEPTCVQCGKLIAERSTIHKIDGRVYCFQCDRALRQEKYLERFVAEGGKIAISCPCGGWIDDAKPSLYIDGRRVCSSCAARGVIDGATERQIEFAKALGVHFNARTTKSEMSDLIEQGIAERDGHRAEPQTQPSGLAIEVITKLARHHRLVAMAYHKPGESEATVRVVEPYSVETTPDHYFVRCWQVHPAPSDGDNWRTFRLDRIADVCDGGGTFQPREQITLGTDDVRPFKFERE